MVDEILAQLSRRFDSMYAGAGRPSIPPEKLLRARLLQMLYSIRSERLLMRARHLGWPLPMNSNLLGPFPCE
jgi:transposase